MDRVYDGNRKSCWTQCVWQPKAIRNQLTEQKIEALNALAREILNARIDALDDKLYGEFRK